VSTTTIKQNIIYGLGEGSLVADATMLTYSLRWANKAYREIFSRYRFKHLRTRSIFTMTHGQSTYQAPTDFIGFLIMKDETNNAVLDQLTPEDFHRQISTSTVTDEDFTTNAVTLATAITLDYSAIMQYSEVVTNTAGTTTYTRSTDYNVAYSAGTITPVAAGSGGTMAVGTAYHIDYLYYAEGKPSKFCIEYDATNTRFVFRVDPIPDASTYICSLLYPAVPSALATGVEPIWSQLEFALESGGIYYGSLELLDVDAQRRAEFKSNYELAIQALIQLDQELEPKHMTIPLRMKQTSHKG
jgi:hypothetical protein